MSSKYFPYSERICYHRLLHGGCTFCGFHMMKNCVSPTPVPVGEMLQHFDEFIKDEKNYQEILRGGRLSVETQGSWFLEVPKGLREHIYRFVESHGLELHSQCRATFYSQKRMCAEGLSEKIAQKAFEATNIELKPYMLISTGLEVADNSDLKLINKGCQLDDYVAFSQFIRSHGAKFAANVLIAPPLVQDPIMKALKTVRYAFEVLGAQEIVIISCIPRLGTPGHILWRQGKWNPISATESSEIFRIAKEKYPKKRIRFDTMRVHGLHGRYTGPQIRTEEQKAAARKNVREIAKKVFSA